MFGQTVTVDGKIGRDFFDFPHRVGGPAGKGESLNVSSGAVIGGRASFEGDRPATVWSEARAGLTAKKNKNYTTPITNAASWFYFGDWLDRSVCCCSGWFSMDYSRVSR